MQGRTKERRYAFDIAFGRDKSNADVYRATCHSLVLGHFRGLNATVFAYGATGSGKTHTMVGTQSDPGLMVLSLQDIFALIAADSSGACEYEVSCSYIEVYNEIIYDLLERSATPLDLREDVDGRAHVSGLRRIRVESATQIMGLLREGNARRKTESTDANAVSSRSHAVLEIVMARSERNPGVRSAVVTAKLALVDLAGSERAHDTNNVGVRARERSPGPGPRPVLCVPLRRRCDCTEWETRFAVTSARIRGGIAHQPSHHRPRSRPCAGKITRRGEY